MSAPGGTDAGKVVPMRALAERQLTSHVGLVVFQASWAMMFGALFFTYALLRLRAPAWPPMGLPALPLALPGVNTLLLLASSACFHVGWGHVRSDRPGRLLPWLVATIVLGTVFMVLQVVVWVGLWSGGVRPDTDVYGSVFYLLTVFHGLHVVVGLGLLAWLVPGAARHAFVAARPGPVGLVGLFWHFVDAVWILVFLTVYVF